MSPWCEKLSFLVIFAVFCEFADIVFKKALWYGKFLNINICYFLTAWYIISRAFVCLSVCMSIRRWLSQSLMYEVHICISGVSPQEIQVKFVYEGHRIMVKVTGAKKVRKSLFPQCKTSIGNNSGLGNLI